MHKSNVRPEGHDLRPGHRQGVGRRLAPANGGPMKRQISLPQATSINMIDMVGIGPFVTMTIVMQTVGSNLFLWAWVFGAVTALVDGMIWSELGAAYPLAGGSYNFLKEAYGPKYGPLLSV